MPSARRRRTVQKQAPGTRRSKPAWRARLTMRSSAPHAPDLSAVRKLAEIPFDFVRKRVSVVVEHGRQDVPHHQGRVSHGARDLHAIC